MNTPVPHAFTPGSAAAAAQPQGGSSLELAGSDWLARPWPCWVEVDLDAVRANVRELQRVARPRLGVTAVLKAQAYGLGATAVARAALEAGANQVAVARVAEGAQLRANGIGAPILILGGTTGAEAGDVVRLGLTAALTDWVSAAHIAREAERAGVRAGVHIKVDTGMNRYGAPIDEALDLARNLGRLPALRLDGFFTHFAAADEQDLWFTRQQLAQFSALCRELEADGVNLGMKHAANSAGALRLPRAGLDSVRAGIALSGTHATEWVPRTPALQPAVALKARVTRLRTPPIGASIGYGRTYRVERPIRTALISCGYADGLPRASGNSGFALVRGHRAPLVGTVSMDLAVADVSQVPDVAVGDEVVLLGRQGDDQISVDDLARWAGIVPHELLVRLGSRAPRLYLEGGLPVSAATLVADRPVPFEAVTELGEQG